MTISSRTPEGFDGRCPVCGKRVVVEPSITHGDATCPNCNTLLWFVVVDDHAWCYERSAVPPELVEKVNQWINAGSLESLELVDLVMELDDLTGEQRSGG